MNSLVGVSSSWNGFGFLVYWPQCSCFPSSCSSVSFGSDSGWGRDWTLILLLEYGRCSLFYWRLTLNMLANGIVEIWWILAKNQSPFCSLSAPKTAWIFVLADQSRNIPLIFLNSYFQISDWPEWICVDHADFPIFVSSWQLYHFCFWIYEHTGLNSDWFSSRQLESRADAAGALKPGNIFPFLRAFLFLI